MNKTKKELEKELSQLQQEKISLEKRYDDALDRKKLAGLYLQVIRLLPEYTDNREGNFLTGTDYTRLTRVLEVDDFPEGF